MMLRSRNSNTNNVVSNQKQGDVIAKRGQKTVLASSENVPSKGEPKPKRAALSDLSRAISNVLINSSKRKAHVSEKKPIIKKRGALRSVDPEHLEKIAETPAEDPCPSYDFDKESASDPNAVHQYAFDIFRYYKSREKMFTVGDYLKNQKFVKKENRAVLVDWMVEIQETFELNHETLYLAVKLVDIFMSRTPNVPKDQLELIACCGLFIASKFDERSPPLIDDFIYVTHDTFDRDAVIKMEMKMIDIVGYDIGCPLSYRYVRRYARVTKEDMGTLTLSRFVLETSLMFYEFIGVSESRLAAAAFLLALKMKNPSATWSPVLHKYSGYRSEEVEPLMWELNHMLHMRPSQYRLLETVNQKYSHEVFFHSAEVPLLQDVFTRERPVQAPSGQGFAL